MFCLLVTIPNDVFQRAPSFSEQNDLHLSDFAVHLSQRQKAANVRSCQVLLHPLDTLGKEPREQVLVRELNNRFDVVRSDVRFVGVYVPKKKRNYVG